MNANPRVQWSKSTYLSRLSVSHTLHVDEEGRSSEWKHKYWEMVADSLQICTPEQWYTVNHRNHTNENLQFLLNEHGTLANSLMHDYWEYNWQAWLFKGRKPTHFWHDVDTHREYFDWLAIQLGISSHDGWYRVKKSDIMALGGGSVLVKHYIGSLKRALMTIYPDVEWQPWQFGSVAPGFWHDAHNQRKYFDWFAERWNMENTDSWYSISWKNIADGGGTSVLQSNEHSHIKAIARAYPDTTWQPWRFVYTNENYWDVLENQRVYLHWLADELCVTKMEDWYGVNYADVIEREGGSLLKRYGNSIIHALMALFPDFAWHPWRFGTVPHHFWSEEDNHCTYMQWLAVRLNIVVPEGWYAIQSADIVKEDAGASFLSHHGFSHMQALKEVYPEYNWLPWLFDRAPGGYWEDKRNHKIYFDWLAQKLHIQSYEDWYKVKQADIIQHGGATLIKTYYEGCPCTALTSVYPQFDFVPWKFEQAPKGYWNDSINRSKYIGWLEEQLGIHKMEDWYGHTASHLTAMYGSSLLRQEGSLMNVIMNHYPMYDWDPQRWNEAVGSKGQQFLHKIAKNVLWSGICIEENHCSKILKYSKTDRKMRFDIWIPKHNLYLEYQGVQHYYPNFFYWSLGRMTKLFQKDEEKRIACANAEVTMIRIPYWWNLTEDSIAATIHKYCPEAIHEGTILGKEIPDRWASDKVQYFER